MTNNNFIFKKARRHLYENMVYPGPPFRIKYFTYTLRIRPKSEFWRLGIRLSRDKNVTFYNPTDTYYDPALNSKYIDICLDAGDFDGLSWSMPNLLQLTRSDIKGQNQMLAEYESYEENTEIFFRLSYSTIDSSLTVSFNRDNQIGFSKEIPIDGDFNYFKIFAWVSEEDLELACDVEVDSNIIHEKDVVGFKIDNLTFRLGDMFDHEIIDVTNLLLLPASSNGSATSNILNRASELGIPYPPRNKAGSILLYQTSKVRDFWAGYGYSVDDQHSDERIIADLCESLLINADDDERKRVINIPLFGTGAGNLNAVDIASIYIAELSASKSRHFYISVKDDSAMRQLIAYFKGRYDELLLSEEAKKPDVIRKIEKSLNAILDISAFSLNENDEITRLSLSNCSFDIRILYEISSTLTILSLINCKCDFSGLSRFKKLHSLYLNENVIEDYSFLKNIKELKTLDLGNNDLFDVSFLRNCRKLNALHLRGNKLEDVGTPELPGLEILDMSDNKLSDLSSIVKIKKLSNLNIADNTITNISALSRLENLEILDISHNRISDVATIASLKKLQYLKADANPFLKTADLILNEFADHLAPIRNYLSRQAEIDKEKLILPTKVLLLGNHASGKSSLLYYLLNSELAEEINSTHIVRIERYPDEEYQIPHAIFFDFGGQDYYHGIYRAFLSAGSIYLILWNTETDKNLQREDSNDILTQDFTLNYWLAQKRYLENEFFDVEPDPVLLIQSFADRDKRKSFVDQRSLYSIENEFYVSLANTVAPNEERKRGAMVNEQALKYLRESVLALIDRMRPQRYEPKWYVNFIAFIIYRKSHLTYRGLSVEKVILPSYGRHSDDDLTFLKEDLDQLHKQGLVLYYKNELPDTIWLNPPELVTYVHNTLLDKNEIASFEGRVPFEVFEKFDVEIISLLRLQKVIFLHEFGENGREYIIPNFLRLSIEDEDDLDFFTFGFGKPLFTIKFTDFLPFGLINQIICFFGMLNYKKKFWRDQVLFHFLDKAKILIHIDFQNLEIGVFSAWNDRISYSEINDITKYLFYCIIGLYWNFELLGYDDFILYIKDGINTESYPPGHSMNLKIEACERIYNRDECRPLDMYISIDDVFFIYYRDLCSTENSTMINARKADQNRLFVDSTKVIPIFPFQAFTKRRLKRAKKVAISYSKSDLSLVNKFRDYLVPLFHDELIDHPWYCTELIAGTEWNNEIQRRFEEADIIFFMISENLMSTKYVLDNEIKNAIDKWDRDKSVKIIPIILEPYHFARKGVYDLSRFNALPYMLKPVSTFANRKIAWHTISESIRLMIEKDFNPESKDEELSKELKEIYERIAHKTDV